MAEGARNARLAELFPGFEELWIATAATTIHAMAGGSGPPLLLLHGYPQTLACWHKVVGQLAASHAVVAMDLRGYGDSGQVETDERHSSYSKRAMALDAVEVMQSLGYTQFAAVGHDRGGRVAYRMAFDHPRSVTRLAVLDIIPTYAQWKRYNRQLALASYHWQFLAQPYDLPESMLLADPARYLDWTLKSWRGGARVMDERALAEYTRCFRRPEVVHAACEDYRAGAGIDYEIDEADLKAGNRIGCPVLALWGDPGVPTEAPDRRGFLTEWRRWAADVSGRPIDAGHFLQEEAPDQVAAELLRFLG
jgi:haloacetate dehalogenase